MLKHELKKLISTLSPSEIKYFKRNCITSNTKNNDYNVLFDILLSTSSVSEAEKIFSNKYPKKKIDNTVRYLYDVLTDMLVKFRIKNDRWFQRHYGLMKARLCFERSLLTMGHRELNKTNDLAFNDQDYFAYYQCIRMRLNHINNTNFQNLTEKELVDLQMEGRQTLQTLKQIHEHNSLYESLRYRFANSNHKQPQKDINDLIISELNIISKGNKKNYESNKLHLLFQSFFFIQAHEYHSALKIFKTLNKLFEENKQMWDSPPYDYLSSLDGILDSLRSIKYFSEMEYFVEKIKNLISKQYPEHFTSLAITIASIYQMNIFIGKNDPKGALDHLKEVNCKYSIETRTNSYSRGMELFLFIAVAYLMSNDFRKANRYVILALEKGNDKYDSIIYKVCHLLHIIIHAELENVEYLGHKIRAYKRQFKKHGKLLKIERLIFKVVSLEYKRLSNIRKSLEWNKIESKIEITINEEQESQLLKYFNFYNWIKDALDVEQKSERIL